MSARDLAFAKQKEFTAQVKRDAKGNWHRILWTLAPEIHPALQRVGRHMTCPFHGGKDDFRAYKSAQKGDLLAESGVCVCTCGTWDGFELLQKLRGWEFPQAVEEVNLVLNGRGYQPTAAYQPPACEPKKKWQSDRSLKERMSKWWDEAVPLDHDDAVPARRYFKQRKLGEVLLPLHDVRLHPDMGYYSVPDEGVHPKLLGRWPALIAVVRCPNGKVSTVHRTWITPEGQKAPVPKARKQYTSPEESPVVGAAIRLDTEVGLLLNLGEGIESCLAARAITRQPTWSCLNKELLRQVVIPESVRIVTIWADMDRSGAGQEAAVDLAKRLCAQGIAVNVMMPPAQIPDDTKGIDWNDIVASAGLDNVRKHFAVVRQQRWVAEKLAALGIELPSVSVA